MFLKVERPGADAPEDRDLAAGFIDGFGYIGASMTGVFTGWLVDNYSWTAGFWYWIIAALIAAFIMLALWRVPVVEQDECD